MADRRTKDREKDPVGLVATLVLCLLGGAVLAGVAGLLLGLPLPATAIAALVIGVGTWLPPAVRSRSEPDGGSSPGETP
ncbi:hypothetical protein FSY75_13565 [Streptomyces sp. TR1341]|uniref:Putative PurR-regulated permease PerM n=1 Tax=Streptomyces murinus TaxID=33900 RepID=A0A7W3NW65_STRMR|nr:MULTISPECIES: hypothetical protein [Streptomyces]MBA9057768.1 putative PurR-regulated permease PerM [Streptomyces murinus]NDK25463.1 hypothetical protein [Streptomyces sp. TR1341]UWW92014.1 hypothetical protein GO605_15085 [Streptomyces murinus]